MTRALSRLEHHQGSVWRASAALLIAAGGCAKPLPPAPLATAPAQAQAQAPPPALEIPKLPIALAQWTTCVHESGRGRCHFGPPQPSRYRPPPPPYEFPVEGVRALGASFGSICAVHDDAVDCRLDHGRGASLQFAVPGAVELILSWETVCVKTADHQLDCRYLERHTGTLSPSRANILAEQVADFDLYDTELTVVDREGLVWRASLTTSEASEELRLELSDRRELPFPKAKRVSAGIRTITAVSEAGEVWAWTEPKSKRERARSSEPARKVEGLEAVMDVVGKDGAICATTETGVWCLGDNYNGQLGPTESVLDVPPTKMPIPGQPRAIESALGMFCAGDADGLPHCWGAGDWSLTRGLYEHGEPIISSGSVSIEVAHGRVCSTDGEGRRVCHGQDPQSDQNPFTMERGWEPAFRAGQDIGSATLADGVLLFSNRTLASDVLTVSVFEDPRTFRSRICYIGRAQGLVCVSDAGEAFEVQGAEGAVDVVRFADGACVLMNKGRASCFDIPASPKLRTTNTIESRQVWKAKLRPVRGAKGLTNIEGTMHYLCGLNEAEHTIDCWTHGEERESPRRLDLAAKTLRMAADFGYGLTVDSKPYALSERASGELAVEEPPEPLDRPVEQLEFDSRGPLCTRDAEGRVDCIGLYRHGPVRWPPSPLRTPLE